jgi:hypothetical protein
MTDLEIREKFVADHAHLRGKISVLRSLATQVLRGDEDLGDALRLKGKDLQLHLIRHMKWEESDLLPCLREIDGAAADAADQLFEEHTGQRQRLSDSLIALEGADGNPLALANHLLELTRWLEQDMNTEESGVLPLMPDSAPLQLSRTAARYDRT